MDELDGQIKDWGKRHSPAPGREDKLAAKIMRAIRQLSGDTQPDESRHAGWHWAPRLALAAGLVLAGMVAGIYLTWPSQKDGIARAAGLSRADLAEIKQVVSEIDRLFPEGVRWISKVNGKLSFQPAAQRRITTAEQPDRRLLISYTVLRQTGAGHWEQISRHDIVTYAGEPVELAGEQKTTIWCHLTTDAQAVVWTDMELHADQHVLQIQDESIQAVGEPTVALMKTIGNVNYKVARTVRIL